MNMFSADVRHQRYFYKRKFFIMNIENMCETIDAALQTKTLDIPIRVTMTSMYDAPFEFTASIDELGQILLTPTTKDVEFTSANTESNVEYDIPIMEQQTVITSEENLTVKETSILIRATMIIEDTNADYSADVDEIGQVVIYPVGTKNTFVTAAVDDSLNLVTEELKSEEYFGYKLINNGDGWNIIDCNGNIIEEGVATLHEAKIIVCKEELSKLESLVENVDNTDSTSEDPTESDPDASEKTTTDPAETVKAEVIEEAVTDVDKDKSEFDEKQIEEALSNITDEFTSSEGAVKCDTRKEQSICVSILEQHYNLVNTSRKHDMCIVEYGQLKNIEETN